MRRCRTSVWQQTTTLIQLYCIRHFFFFYKSIFLTFCKIQQKSFKGRKKCKQKAIFHWIHRNIFEFSKHLSTSLLLDIWSIFRVFFKMICMQALFTIAILSIYHSIVFLHGVKGQIELTWTNTLTWFFSKKKKEKNAAKFFRGWHTSFTICFESRPCI